MYYLTLMNFQLHGDLDAFINNSDTCIMTMSDPPNEHMLRALLETQLRKCMALNPLFVSIDGSVPDSPQRLGRFLCDAVNREIACKQNETVRLEFTQIPKTAHAAAAQSAAQKAAANAKTAAKQQSRRPQAPPPPPAAGDAPAAGSLSKLRCRTMHVRRPLQIFP